MRPEDPRHGTTAGYSKHHRDGEEACQPCKTAATERAAAQRESEDDIALTDGAWRLDPWRRVLVWVPEPWSPPKPDLSDIIACPTCHARVNESCTGRTGNRRQAHADRLIARRCLCGNDLAPKRRMCSECAADAKAAWRLRYRQKVAA